MGWSLGGTAALQASLRLAWQLNFNCQASLRLARAWPLKFNLGPGPGPPARGALGPGKFESEFWRLGRQRGCRHQTVSDQTAQAVTA